MSIEALYAAAEKHPRLGNGPQFGKLEADLLAANSAAKRADTGRYWAYDATRRNGSDEGKQH